MEVTASREVMRGRINLRQENRLDASEANLDVLEYQLGIAQPLSIAERANAIICDSTVAVDIDLIADGIRAKMQRSN